MTKALNELKEFINRVNRGKTVNTANALINILLIENHITQAPSEEERLARVLSKMDRYQNHKLAHSYLYLLDTNLSIDYRNNKFYLEGVEQYDSVNISLSAVEEILKSLEEEKHEKGVFNPSDII